MGYMAHHTIVVTGWDATRVQQAHDRAKELWGGAGGPSEIHVGRINGYTSFFIPPDGSKEGWPESDLGDERRKHFITWLQKTGLDFAEVRFGGDDPQEAEIISGRR